jgi:hypothetical protein
LRSGLWPLWSEEGITILLIWWRSRGGFPLIHFFGWLEVVGCPILWWGGRGSSPLTVFGSSVFGLY